MKRAEIVILSLVLLALTVSPTVAETIDPFTTGQSLSTTAGNHSQSIVDAPDALGGKRRGNVIGPDSGSLSMTIGDGEVAYKLEGSGGQGGQIGWLWYVDPSASVTPVDLTGGGKYDAFQIEVLDMTESIVVQVDALDADMRFDSVASIVGTKPEQPLVYSFSSFITPNSPAKVDFTRIIGVQVEIDLHKSETGSLKLGPLTTITSSASPGD